MIYQFLIIIAILNVGVVYGTDMFYALIVRKATALSKDSSIADLTGHTHLIADKRMPVFGITAILCSAVSTFINFNHGYTVGTLLLLLCHLFLYQRIAKPINVILSQAAEQDTIPENVRALQKRWDSIIAYRAALLALAMLLLILAIK
jgi:hypothetical protein